jgi:hypothetical protein
MGSEGWDEVAGREAYMAQTKTLFPSGNTL